MRYRNDTSHVLILTDAPATDGQPAVPAVAVEPGAVIDWPHHVVGLTPVADTEPAEIDDEEPQP